MSFDFDGDKANVFLKLIHNGIRHGQEPGLDVGACQLCGHENAEHEPMDGGHIPDADRVGGDFCWHEDCSCMRSDVESGRVGDWRG